MIQPWKDRPDSLQRGFVAGSMTVGWFCAFSSVIGFLVGGPPIFIVFSMLYFGIAVLATYMWVHG